MSSQFFSMSLKAFIIINSPLVVVNFTANIFFAYCLIFPRPYGQRLKRPLKVLLGILVWSSIFYCVSLAMLYYVLNDLRSYEALVLWLIGISFVNNGTACSVWLNFFYCVQIVPSQRAFLIWIKKNIASFIYVALFSGGMLCFCNTAGTFAGMIISKSANALNGTKTKYDILVLKTTEIVYFSLFRVYTLVSVCVMIASSVSTVHYLHRHIRSMVQSGSSFSTPKIQSQIRVAVTGVSQGVLYFLLDTYNVVESFTNSFSQHNFGAWVSLTVLSLYITGTTVNLGIGQAAFRRRVVGMWKTIKKLFLKCSL